MSGCWQRLGEMSRLWQWDVRMVVVGYWDVGRDWERCQDCGMSGWWQGDIRMWAETMSRLWLRDVRMVAGGCWDVGRDWEKCQDCGRGMSGCWQRLRKMLRWWQRDARMLAETERCRAGGRRMSGWWEIERCRDFSRGMTGCWQRLRDVRMVAEGC